MLKAIAIARIRTADRDVHSRVRARHLLRGDGASSKLR